MTLAHRSTIGALIGGLALGLTFGSGVAAQQLGKVDGYPSRPITVIVPYGPGGGADTMVRAWTPAAEEISPATFRVVNKPGGSGFAAIPDYMARPKDGYTIIEHDNTLPPGQLLGQVEIDVFEALDPICITNAAFSQLYIRTDDQRFSDWQSFLQYSKNHPGEITVGNVGLEMIQVDLLEESAGFKVKQVNFDKPAERYAAVVGGHTDALYEQPGDVINFLEGGQMKPILTFLHADRPKAFPGAPTLDEAGYEDVPLLLLVRMFWVHNDAPQERKDWLKRACKLAFETESFQNHLERKYLHFARSYYNSEDATKLLGEMTEVYKQHFKRTGQIE